MTQRSRADPHSAARPQRSDASSPILRDPHEGIGVWSLHVVYDALWLIAIVVTTPWWLVRGVLDRRFRALTLERLALRLPASLARRDRERVLIHGVSVGEVKAASSLVAALERERPELEIVICTTTATGFELARKLYPTTPVARFPLDLSWVARRFLRKIAPRAVVLMELEVWPNFLRECNRLAAPVAVVNGRITPRSFARYRHFRSTLPQFDRISLFCVQAEEYAERFRRLGGARERVLITGNVKADGLRIGAVAPNAELARLLGARAGQRLIVAGSTHRPEERWVTSCWLAGASGARLVLVPRHPPRASEVLADLATLGVRGQLLTALRAGEAPDPARPAIVDTIGELEAVYALADLVYVGGSLVPHGGQNVLEPAAQGRAVLHGPHVENFLQEAALLDRAGASRCVADPDGLTAALRELLADDRARERMGAAGLEAVAAQKGATELTLHALLERCLAVDTRASAG